MNGSDEVLAKLDVLIQLAAISTRLSALAACGDHPQREKIALLDAVGLPPKEIAELLGTTRNTVSVALVGLRRDRKAKRGSKAAIRRPEVE